MNLAGACTSSVHRRLSDRRYTPLVVEPQEATRGGAATMYPEYKEKIATMAAAN